jgi:hypothetical protein
LRENELQQLARHERLKDSAVVVAKHVDDAVEANPEKVR